MLIEKHTIWYAPSASVLHLIETRPVSRRTNLPALAVATGSEATQKAVEGIQRGAFDLEGAVLPELPASASEARIVAATLGNGSVVLTGNEATEAAVKRQPLDNFRVLHFAVHGLSDSERPERAGLVFNSDPGSGEDGIWQPREIMRNHLNAALVTLSACQTARGKVMGADGNASLVTPFLAAGAKAVVATLWDSDDLFTRALMREFYGEISRGAPPADALQKAKLDLISHYGKATPPYLWAGFILTGVNERMNP